VCVPTERHTVPIPPEDRPIVVVDQVGRAVDVLRRDHPHILVLISGSLNFDQLDRRLPTDFLGFLGVGSLPGRYRFERPPQFCLTLTTTSDSILDENRISKSPVDRPRPTTGNRETHCDLDLDRSVEPPPPQPTDRTAPPFVNGSDSFRNHTDHPNFA